MTLVHQQHFIHPDHPEVHTQNAENMWIVDAGKAEAEMTFLNNPRSLPVVSP